MSLFIIVFGCLSLDAGLQKKKSFFSLTDNVDDLFDQRGLLFVVLALKLGVLVTQRLEL